MRKNKMTGTGSRGRLLQAKREGLKTGVRFRE
ncbi:hypothetical protein CLS_16850 [[Clostridium] cf. saccharolyticum K10]|nr:hypothetical protein CLS_16850 [[Clostridium] cf. saccharolyticum K10]